MRKDTGTTAHGRVHPRRRCYASENPSGAPLASKMLDILVPSLGPPTNRPSSSMLARKNSA